MMVQVLDLYMFFVVFFDWVCVCVGGRVGHSHPESPESCQSVLQILLLAGGHMCYMSPPLLLLLLTHRICAT